MYNKRNINNFFIFLLPHLYLDLYHTLTNNNLPLDTIEALAWGSNLDWGFNKHPPCKCFCCRIFYQIFGNQDWAYYLLSQIFVIIAFIILEIFRRFFKNNILSLFQFYYSKVFISIILQHQNLM